MIHRKLRLNLVRWSLFFTFAHMNENEYMDFYCQHLLWQVQLDEKTAYYDNDISTLNYDAVIHNDEEFGITKDSFLLAIKFYANKCKMPINLDALWKLSILIWHWKALHLIAMPEIRDVDQYIKFASFLKAGLAIENITITGKLPNKSRKTKITLSSNEVINCFKDAMFNEAFSGKLLADDNRKNYTLGSMEFALDVLDKRTIAYQVARELAEFFQKYNRKKKIDGSTKNMIMSILQNFSLVREKPNNTDYNKLFSDAKTGRLPICDHCYQPTIIKGFGIFDYTIIKSPK